MLRPNHIQIYNPNNLTQEELINSYVVRMKEFTDLFEEIKSSKMTHPEQHFIIQGVRGQGKTTLLLRIYYEILRDKQLLKRIAPVIFNEEQYNISALSDLWESVAEYLEDDEEFAGLYDEMKLKIDAPDYEMTCFEILEERLKRNRKKLILFIDNFGLLLDKFSKMEHHRLREILLESAELRIVGSSSIMLEYTYRYDKPFFHFFNIVKLKGLNSEESKTLLIELGKLYNNINVEKILNSNPGRIEALRRLTGGVIRTIVLLFEIFMDDNEGSAFVDLEKILDNVTPLYKQRMDDLSPPQQKIVDAIAINWDAVAAKEIAKKTRERSKLISAQLNQLQKSYIIEIQKTTTKNNLYRIRERFFNIWYLMRQSRRKDVNKVRFLVEFLEIWCDKDELHKRALLHLNAIEKKDVYPKYALYYTEALKQTDIPEDTKDRLTKDTRKFVKEHIPELLRDLSSSRSEIKRNAVDYFNKGDYDRALKELEKIKYKDAATLNILGIIYSKKKDFNKAEKYYQLAHEKGDSSSLNNLSWMYFEERIDKTKALNYAGNSYKIEKGIITAHTYSTILLWNNEFEKAYEISQEFLDNEESYKKFPKDVLFFLMLLMAKRQYHLTLRIFNENRFDLKDRFKPVYYALMYFMQNEHPNEYRKMGEELKQTVEEIIEEINGLERDYE